MLAEVKERDDVPDSSCLQWRGSDSILGAVDSRVSGGISVAAMVCRLYRSAA